MITVVDADGTIRYLSPSVKMIFGYGPDAALGRDFLEFIHPEDNARIAEDFSRLTRGSATLMSTEGRLQHRDGSWRILEFIVSRLTGDGERTEFVVNARDITERKQAEVELKESEERYRTVFENTGTATAILEEDTTIAMVNAVFEELSGYSKEEIEGRMSWTELIVEEDLERMRNYHSLRRIEADKAPHNYEFCLIRRDGTVRDMFLTVALIPGTRRSIVSLIDITEKKQMEETIKRRSKEMTILLDNIETQIWYATDPETYGIVNRARAEFLGVEKEDLRGKKLRDILRGDEVEVCIAGNREAFEGKKIQNEEWIRAAKGNLRCNLVTKIPKMDENGNVEYVVCTGQDITERKQAEEALRMLNKKFNLLGKITGHDILNQLSVMGGYESLLEESLEDERLLNYLNRIIKAGKKIEEMLEFRREYEKMVTEEPEWVNVAKFVNQAATDLPFREVSLRVDIDSLEIFADPLIGKVFYNLLHNSLEHGGDLTEIRVFDETTEQSIILVFEDDGVGVPEDKKEKIFEYGYGKHLGYGLHHIREILDIYRMSIMEVGEPGKGARFEIHVPKGNCRNVGGG